MKKVGLSLISIMVLSGSGFAAENMNSDMQAAENDKPFYAGIALSAVSTRGSSVDLNFFSVEDGQDRLGNVTFNLGYDYNEYLAFEGRYTTTFKDEDVVEMNGWSIFLKPQYPVNEDFTIYALLGFGGVKIENYLPGRTFDLDDTGFQWGFGLSYSLKNLTDYDFVIYADYTSLATDMDGVYWNGDLQTEADALTVGLTYRF